MQNTQINLRRSARCFKPQVLTEYQKISLRLSEAYFEAKCDNSFDLIKEVIDIYVVFY